MKNLVSKVESSGKRKNPTVETMFKAKIAKDEKAEFDRLEKEKRLEKQRFLMRGWKENCAHHDRLHWAKEWLVDTVIKDATDLADGHNSLSSLS